MRNTGPTKAVRDLVLSRAQGVCERCGAAPATDLHHRRPRGMGGDRSAVANSPANLLACCRDSHRWIEANRAVAEARGWIVRRPQDPRDVEVTVVPHGRVLLSDDGTYMARVGVER